jgi:hypothetical protein
MTTSETLRAAKRHLLTHGWTQGCYRNETTEEVCTVGAIVCVTKDQRAQIAALELMQAELQLASSSYNPLVGWNDTPGRQPEEVLALFDRSIARAEGLEQETEPDAVVSGARL